MSEHLVPLSKESGGTTLTGPDGEQYEWAKDGSIVDVPYAWALELLAIQGGGFAVADEKKAAHAAAHEPPWDVASAGEPGGETRQVIEPAPGRTVADRMVTEPGPSPDREISEGSQAPVSGDASPITPKPRAGTRSSAKK